MERKFRKKFESYFFFGLLPVYFISAAFLGFGILAVFLTSVLTGLFADFVFSKVFKKNRAAKTWLIWALFPLVLPPTIPFWMVIIGIIFTLFFAVFLFGGYGCNLFHSISIGVIFLLLSYPVMFKNSFLKPPEAPLICTQNSPQKTETNISQPSLPELLKGRISENIGDTCPVYLVVFILLFLYWKLIDFRLLTTSLLGTLLFSGVGNFFLPDQILPPHIQIFTGTFLLTLILISADIFCLPRTFEGRWLGGIILSFFTVLIRSFSNFSEGVFFATLLMNVFTPIFDYQFTRRFYFLRKSKIKSQSCQQTFEIPNNAAN
ncbi:MAG: RnfABCDGE type electron transport complex subunit D [Candidatus Riflebacteria bacterium]|nr:RnfABCDGE type electron transport complex subunit D [Candidatus Riflebacteria bacterium]